MTEIKNEKLDNNTGNNDNSNNDNSNNDNSNNDNSNKNGPDQGQAADIYQRAQIKDMGSTTTRTDKGVIHCLTIVGQIEGHQVLPQDTKSTKYEHVMPQLAAIEESEEIEGLLVLLNTVGGDIEAGLGIAEMIASMKKPTASLVLGGGHSIGVPLAGAARHSVIAPSASMTIHPVRLTASSSACRRHMITSARSRSASCSS